MVTFKNVNNMKTLNDYNLKRNPFRTTPASNPNEIIWAGFDDVRGKIENRIKRAISIPNSSLVLIWGEYGSGKTHAARFFQKEDILSRLSGEEKTLPIPFLLDFPQGKEPVKELYTQVIDKLNLKDLRKQFEKLNITDILQKCTDNVLIQNILKLLFDNQVSETLIKTYLYGNAPIKVFTQNNVQRKLESDNDYTEFLAALFSFLAYEKNKFSCVILWFDEFENIATLNMANVTKMNACIRTLMDKAPNNLLIFMNLTQSAMMDVDDLSAYLQESVLSRIKEKIELPIPDETQVKEYLKGLLNNPIYRLNEKKDSCEFSPFSEDVVNMIIKDLGASASLRKYNEIFSALLENAIYDEKDEIDLNYYNRIKNEILS